MCGFAGVVGEAAGQVDEERLERVIASLAHRGPDGRGRFVAPGVRLVHTRLSIIDIEGSAQPMTSASGRFTVVYNGEIYGYRGLRQELATYPFKTQGDTEGILALCETAPARLPSALLGMFAYAVWDATERRLVLGRDRFGEKPLYYANLPDGGLVFASEIKAILAFGLSSGGIDHESLTHYLHYLSAPPDRTMYSDVASLPPGCILEWRAGRVRVERYWQPPTPDASPTEPEAAMELRRLAEQAVQDELVADVGVGALLSGGLDSSTIVALAARAGGSVRTFSFGFPGQIDERPYAREVARMYGTNHHESTDETSIADLLYRMIDVYDEPFADSSNVATYLLCKTVAEHVKVVLSGDGADELFGGYDFWYGAADRRLTERGPRAIARALLGRNVLRHHEKLRDSFPASLLARAGYGGRTQATPWYRRSALAPALPSEERAESVLAADVCDYLPADILVKVDRAAMAWGLEVRAPFLHPSVAEYALALPWRLKVGGDRFKRVFRSAFEDLWPTSVRTRKKQGFGAPLAAWLARPDAREVYGDLVETADSPLGRLFDRRRLAAALDRLDSQQRWTLLTLALWLQRKAP